MKFQKMLSIASTIAAIGCLTIAHGLAATVGTTTCTTAEITYTASGTFASTPLRGADTLKLAGEPFSVSIKVCASTPPTKIGPNYALYTLLTLTGAVHSGLTGSTPVDIKSTGASIEQAIDPGKYDLLQLGAPIRVVKINLTIRASVQMPVGTLTKPLLHPFNPVTLSSSNATVTYSDGTNSTTLAVQTGTVKATIPTAAATTAKLKLSPTGAEATVAHSDGTQSVRSLSIGPLEAGVLADTIRVKFYAIGVRDASDVHVQIAGEQVPVLYAGASGYYPGLDEVIVEVPHSLAGRGVTDVVLTADEQASAPVPIHIQ
jgi:uncharacterized protein (TIGR03437 family)